MSESNTLLLIVIAAVIVAAAYYYYEAKPQSQTTDNTRNILRQIQHVFATKAAPRQSVPVLDTVTALTIVHNDPLLLTLFTKDVQLLPDGVTAEQFERQVAEYQQKYLKTPEVKIPRSLGFSYDKYVADQERIARESAVHHQQFTSRGDVGTLSEKLARGVPLKLHVKTFLKKVKGKK